MFLFLSSEDRVKALKAPSQKVYDASRHIIRVTTHEIYPARHSFDK